MTQVLNSNQIPEVSVVIPAYKVARFIEETLQSVLSQTFADYEVIIVNDGSPDTDQLEQILEPFQDRINYIKQSNKGAGAARNTGVRAARGYYVAFLDGDDVWNPNFLKEQLKLIKSDGGYDLVYANAILIGDSPWAGKTFMDKDPSEGPATLEALLGERCMVLTSAVLAKREPILKVGLFDETLRNSQDFDLWVRLAKHAKARIGYQRKVLLQHRAHAGSLASDGIRSVEGELKVLFRVREWRDLSSEERGTLESTIALRTASVSLDRGKRQLLASDYKAASESFSKAYDYYKTWKLRLVLAMLRVAPGSLRWILQKRPV